MIKLTPELKKKWVDALRSGKYRQSRGALKGQRGYCCLGVLASLAGVEDEKLKKYSGDPLNNFGIELPVHANKRERADTETCLISLNDDAHYSFKKIADWVERYL